MVHERHFLPENDKKGYFFPEPPVRAHLKFIYPWNFFCQKSELSDSAETPPPLVKSDTLLKNIFIAFLNSTAFVCYLEINLFFPTQKSEEKLSGA